MGAEFCRRDLLSLFPDNTIISLPQTVSFSSTRTGVYEKRLSQSIYAKHKNHIIFARERYSFDFLKKTFLNSSIYLIPDIVLLYSDYSIRKEPNRTALLCLRSDCEGIFCAEDRKKIYRSIVDRFENIRFTDTFVDCVNIDDRKSMIEKKLSEFASAELVITDRLHGMVLAALAGTPCVVLPNYNNKVKGVYAWIEFLKSVVFVEKLTQINSAIDDVIAHKYDMYDAGKLNKNFEMLEKICREHIK